MKTAATLSELRADFELYALNFLSIITKDGDKIPFRMNRAQRKVFDALMWQRARGLPMRVVILKSRQTGISTLIQAVAFWMCHLRENVRALTLAHKGESATHLFGMSREHYMGLPEEGPLAAKQRYFTKREIHFDATNSRTSVEVVGEVRGYTAQILHGSEVAFWQNAKKTLRAIKQTVPRRPETVVALESTPNGFNDFRTVYVRAKKKVSGYIAVFIAWFDDEDSERVEPWFSSEDLDEQERDLVTKFNVSLRQLAWRRKTIEDECDGDLDAFLQEYPSDDHSCFLASGRPAFDSDGLAFQLAAVPPMVPEDSLPRPCEIEFNIEDQKAVVTETPRGRLMVYSPPQDRHQYFVGVDPSEGDRGSDPSPIAVLDRTTLRLAALWWGRTPPDLLARHAVNLCHYYNEAGLIWEANNHGLAFGISVQEMEYPYVYYRRVSDESVARAETDKPGYMSSVKSRSHVVHTLRKYVREQIAQVRDPIMVHEMTTFVFNGDKAEHLDDENDDTLFAFGMPLLWHRGDPDGALTPLSDEILRAAHEEHGWKLRIGQKPDENALLLSGVTCKELEDFDERVENAERRERRFGMGAMR